ncbi:YraN family protein [Acuticoccus sp. I52.16.1]|uniref:YraN family protein n=1 Tax=Acuticoccus sp. I52.16.1 TaxID=2928472 RepID=UPI001FD38170|nr:YraN family protein [Acuticoccus sp. I52.16.1]UOM36057.1 YraN family protein [Acuticoccus sp. I52.16.1]
MAALQSLDHAVARRFVAPPAARAAPRPRPARDRTAAYDFGLAAERNVTMFLVSGGYEIIGRRVRMRAGEVDIIARRDDEVAFVEVKARRRGWDGLISVDERKQRRLSRAADEWLSRNEHFAACSIRFDIALVWKGSEIEYLTNAFDFIPADDFVW